MTEAGVSILRIIHTNNENISKSRISITEITDSNFESEVIECDKKVIVHCSSENEHDLKMIPVLDELFQQYSETVKFCKINVSEHKSTAAKYGVSMTPTLLIFANQKAVAQIIGTKAKEIISAKLDIVIKKPSEELHELNLDELKKGYEPYKTNELQQWLEATISGLVSGVVFAIARNFLEGGIGFIVAAFAYMIFIQNKNMRFSWFQKIFAVGLMLIIGMYWKEIFELLRK